MAEEYCKRPRRFGDWELGGYDLNFQRLFYLNPDIVKSDFRCTEKIKRRVFPKITRGLRAIGYEVSEEYRRRKYRSLYDISVAIPEEGNAGFRLTGIGIEVHFYNFEGQSSKSVAVKRFLRSLQKILTTTKV